MTDKNYQNFNIIRFRGSPTTVTLADGTIIRDNKQDKVWIPEYSGFVKKAPYDLEFIFELPKKIQGPSYMCSCGSPAIVIGSNAYSHLGSPEGMMLVCMVHMETGRHSDGAQ